MRRRAFQRAGEHTTLAITMFRPRRTTPLAAAGASFVDDDDDNEDDPLLTQPPSVLNTVRSPSPTCNPGEFFLDSIRRTIELVLLK